MESTTIGSSQPFDLTRIGPFTEEEMTAMANALLSKIDVPIRSSEPAPKRPLVGFFGTQKSYKTTVTTQAETFFNRNKFKVYCPPESAEHLNIRADMPESPVVFQARHLNVVMDQYLNLAWNRNFHLSMLSRNNDDMLYWYEKGRRKGLYSESHARSAKEWIYQILREGGLDISLFFTCSVEAAMKREYGQSVTQRRGSKMNEQDVAEGLDIYQTIMGELRENVPNLPIFHVDTSEMSVREATEEALRYILPTLCIRYEVQNYTFLPYALSLVQKVAQSSQYYEEQIKLRGHPQVETILSSGWTYERDSHQTDIYLNPNHSEIYDPSGEVIRLRNEDGGRACKFMYKGRATDTLLSHRRPHTFAVIGDEIDKIRGSYREIATLNKKRRHYRKEGKDGSGHFFTLHVDSIDRLGDFTEIRARGSSEINHTEELLALAEELGFSTSSIVGGNYLSLVLKTT